MKSSELLAEIESTRPAKRNLISIFIVFNLCLYWLFTYVNVFRACELASAMMLPVRTHIEFSDLTGLVHQFDRLQGEVPFLTEYRLRDLSNNRTVSHNRFSNVVGGPNFLQFNVDWLIKQENLCVSVNPWWIYQIFVNFPGEKMQLKLEFFDPLNLKTYFALCGLANLFLLLIYFRTKRKDIEEWSRLIDARISFFMSLIGHELMACKRSFSYLKKIFFDLANTREDQEIYRLCESSFARAKIPIESALSILALNGPPSRSKTIHLLELIRNSLKVYGNSGVETRFDSNLKFIYTVQADGFYAIFGNLLKNSYHNAKKIVHLKISQVPLGILIRLKNDHILPDGANTCSIHKHGFSKSGSFGYGLTIVQLWIKKMQIQNLNVDWDSEFFKVDFVIPWNLLHKESMQTQVENQLELGNNMHFIVLDDDKVDRMTLKMYLGNKIASLSEFSNRNELKHEISKISQLKNPYLIFIDRFEKGRDLLLEKTFVSQLGKIENSSLFLMTNYISQAEKYAFYEMGFERVFEKSNMHWEISQFFENWHRNINNSY